MPNQIYNIVTEENIINIYKHTEIIYTINLSSKLINLKELYDKMSIDINDEYYFASGLKKYDNPQNDIERIFNNTFDFMNLLLFNLNQKLNELRNRQESSIFQ